MSCYNTAFGKSVILVRTCVVGTHSNHLIEIFQVSTTTNVFTKKTFDHFSRKPFIFKDFSRTCQDYP